MNAENDRKSDTLKTECCVVGAGPAGILLSLLLAKAGVRVTLLEAHSDLDRDFRGDTIHPGTLELLEQLGLARPLHRLPHQKMSHMQLATPRGTWRLADFRELSTPFPYIMIMPQARFLEFLVKEARRVEGFHLEMGARVKHLVERDGTVLGVRFSQAGQERTVQAPLTVAADGRFSTLRKLSGLQSRSQSPPMDVLWFRVPKNADDPHRSGTFYVSAGHMLVLLERHTSWQAGFVIPKGGAGRLRSQGLEATHEVVSDMLPWLGPRIRQLQSWQDFQVLMVESSLLPKWFRPGLLLIGDAAHVMSPVGGVGIYYAIGDAVEAASVLAAPLRDGSATVEHLARVQRRRRTTTRFIQAVQRMIQRRIIRSALSDRPFKIPVPLRIASRLAFCRRTMAWVIGLGLRRPRLSDSLVRAFGTDAGKPSGAPLQ